MESIFLKIGFHLVQNPPIVINWQFSEDQILIEYVVLKYDHTNLLVPAKLLMSAKKNVDSNNFVINMSHLYPLECPLEGDYSRTTRLNIYFIL